ncbi:DUF881 domain-containing protein [Aeromicrobium phragmitis]|uniref:DUF881 domain-containing protein n=2 Tax=Aeromicrobium phragmitis TaxID=2478914 RepID=A0A3L8PPJ7_9ACTN|nr:DUF881 domain-containing protein [Aeromicrobium phragmitis]
MTAEITMAGAAQRLPIFCGLGPWVSLLRRRTVVLPVVATAHGRSEFSTSLVRMAEHEEPGSARRSRKGWHLAVLAVSVACGFFFVSANVSSAGLDLRPAGGDISTVLSDRARAVEQRQQRAAELQEDIDELTQQVSSTRDLDEARAHVHELEPRSGFSPVVGPGVQITLSDAPRDVEVPDGLDPNFLVVHQQDIQAFVNALWAGGAEAITLQGQRLISTTGIKCVGNTVVLDGVPYSPPYVIEAVGDPWELTGALDDSAEVATYRDWADRYELGYERKVFREVNAPAYQGSLNLQHAEVLN